MSGLLHLAKSLFEISEIDQPEENALRTGGIEKMLQVIQKDVTIAKQENEEDSDDDDSTDENFVGDTIQKFVDIFNERSSVYVIGAPGSGKTTFIEEMTTLVGCNSVTKPNMVHWKCMGDSEDAVVQNHNLHKKIQDNTATYIFPYISINLIEQINDANRSKGNNKVTFFEGSPYDLRAIYLQYALRTNIIDELTYVAARDQLNLQISNAQRFGIFTQFKIFIVLKTELETCKKRLEQKKIQLKNKIDIQKKNSNASSYTTAANIATVSSNSISSTPTTAVYKSNSDILYNNQSIYPNKNNLTSATLSTTATTMDYSSNYKSINQQLTQTEILTPDEIDYQSSFYNDKFLKGIHEQSSKLSVNSLKIFGYTGANSRIMFVKFVEEFDVSTNEYKNRVKTVISKINEEIQIRRKTQILKSFNDVQKKIILNLFREKEQRLSTKNTSFLSIGDDEFDDTENNKTKNEQPSQTFTGSTNLPLKNGIKYNPFRIISFENMLEDAEIRKFIIGILSSTPTSNSPSSIQHSTLVNSNTDIKNLNKNSESDDSDDEDSKIVKNSTEPEQGTNKND